MARAQALKADLFLLIAAGIWGTTFVAQRVGMDSLPPMFYTGARFLLGALVILPLVWRVREADGRRLPLYSGAWAGLQAGLVLFCGISAQQIGLLHTSTANAGFITGLYVVLVPLVGILFGQALSLGVALGAGLAAVGLYLLSVKQGFQISYGDSLQFLGALCWTAHVLLLSHLTRYHEPIRLAWQQFMVCAVLSLISAWIWENPSWNGIVAGWIPLLYGGLLSVGVGFTLQVLAQSHAPAAHAAIILSLEAVIAALAGWVVLNESLSWRALLGCALMLAGMLVAQLMPLYSRRRIMEGGV